MTNPVLVKRPVAFRIPRVVNDNLSATEFRYFTEEAEARAEALALDCECQGLYVRDGAVVVQDGAEVEQAVVERCAQHIESLADKQEETNAKYPDHAKAYPSWVDRISMYRLLASDIRARLGAQASSPQLSRALGGQKWTT